MDSADIERVLDDSWLGEVTELDLVDLRARRAECQTIETHLSYVRRLAQGRLDIVVGEKARRAEGGGKGDLASLIERLPSILADKVRSPGLGRLPTELGPSDPGAFVDELDAILDASKLSELTESTDERLDELVDELTAFEQDVSRRRRSLHERIDVLQAELTRRYRTGEATVDSLLK